MELLKELTEAHGAPGFEHEVRNIMRREMEKANLNVVTDRLGSIFAEKKGRSAKPKVMLAGHMDEVAFMVKEITKDGFLRFVPLGGWWSQVLLSQRVSIIAENGKYTGVIGSKPPHILKQEERNKVYPIEEMFIDIGAHSAEQVKSWGIRVGDPVIPVCPFEILPDQDTILAKALDNRMGCYLVLEVIKKLQWAEHPNTVYAGATVQEEVGLRGAATSPHVIEPDFAIALDVGIAEDTPGTGGENKPKMGHGPLITFLDASMIPHLRFRNFVIGIAEKNHIPYQVEIMPGGGTDAGKFHMFKEGVPSIVVGVAARYIHSHVSMVSRQDLENAVKLLVEVLKQLDAGAMESIMRF